MCGVLGLLAIGVGAYLYRRRQSRRLSLEAKEKPKGVIRGTERDTEGSFEMGPAGKYVSLKD